MIKNIFLKRNFLSQFINILCLLCANLRIRLQLDWFSLLKSITRYEESWCVNYDTRQTCYRSITRYDFSTKQKGIISEVRWGRVREGAYRGRILSSLLSDENENVQNGGNQPDPWHAQSSAWPTCGIGQKAQRETGWERARCQFMADLEYLLKWCWLILMVMKNQLKVLVVQDYDHRICWWNKQQTCHRSSRGAFLNSNSFFFTFFFSNSFFKN